MNSAEKIMAARALATRAQRTLTSANANLALSRTAGVTDATVYAKRAYALAEAAGRSASDALKLLDSMGRPDNKEIRRAAKGVRKDSKKAKSEAGRLAKKSAKALKKAEKALGHNKKSKR